MLALLILGGLASSFLVVDLIADSDDNNDKAKDTPDDPVEETTLYGTSGADEIIAEAPFDTIFGRDGDDYIEANTQHSTVHAGPGDDEVLGSTGRDLITGDLGDDIIYLGSAPDEIAGDDVMQMLEDVDYNYSELDGEALAQSSVAGNDIIYGEGNADKLIDLHGSNQIYGGEGGDRITTVDAPGTEHAPDLLEGGYGSDTYIADDGDVIVNGNSGEGDSINYYVWVDEEDDEPVTISNMWYGQDLVISISADLVDEGDSLEPVVTPIEDIEDAYTVTVAGQDVAIVHVLQIPTWEFTEEDVADWTSVEVIG